MPRQPTPMFDLSQRLTDNQLSLAWAHLSMTAQQESHLPLPIPKELRHLTELEWHLVSALLNSSLEQRSQRPVH